MSSEHTAFSASGEDVITRVIDVQTEEVPFNDELFDEFYEITRTAEEIIKGDYKRIALQFPDELLHDSVPIFRRLKPILGAGRDLYVLADTSYGSCCVDEVAAQHVDADAMVHYGHACLSQTSRLPVIYIFGRQDLDVDLCVERLMEAFDSSNRVEGRQTVLLRYDVSYAHLAGEVQSQLRKALEPRQIPLLHHEIPVKAAPVSGSPAKAVPADVPPEHTTVFYIGKESLALTNLLMTSSLSDVYSYNPTSQTARLESSRTNRLLMRRYAVVQKARDADIFGILVGTLGVASYLPLIKHLRTLLAKHQKKSYTISVGKLNPAKLANFMEIGCFVLVACPENSLVEAKDFLRPIVTPYELEVALQAEQSWTGRYVLDFEKLLADYVQLDGVVSGAEEDESEDPDQPVFSLITGSYRHPKRYGAKPSNFGSASENSAAVILRNQDNSLTKLADSAAGQFLQQRSYQGLEVRLGEDAPSILEQGDRKSVV